MVEQEVRVFKADHAVVGSAILDHSVCNAVVAHCVDELNAVPCAACARCACEANQLILSALSDKAAFNNDFCIRIKENRSARHNSQVNAERHGQLACNAIRTLLRCPDSVFGQSAAGVVGLPILVVSLNAGEAVVVACIDTRRIFLEVIVIVQNIHEKRVLVDIVNAGPYLADIRVINVDIRRVVVGPHRVSGEDDGVDYKIFNQWVSGIVLVEGLNADIAANKRGVVEKDLSAAVAPGLGRDTDAVVYNQHVVKCYLAVKDADALVEAIAKDVILD